MNISIKRIVFTCFVLFFLSIPQASALEIISFDGHIQKNGDLDVTIQYELSKFENIFVQTPLKSERELISEELKKLGNANKIIYSADGKARLLISGFADINQDGEYDTQPFSTDKTIRDISLSFPDGWTYEKNNDNRLPQLIHKPDINTALTFDPNGETFNVNLKKTDILVFAPHPDDEALGVGGTIYKAIQAGKNVKVIVITNGDAYERAYNNWPSPKDKNGDGKIDKVDFGYTRQEETISAMEILGLSANDIIFLGYPDNALIELWTRHWGIENYPYHHKYTNSDYSPYSNSYYPNTPNCGEALLRDIKDILNRYKPSEIYVTHYEDDNSDHKVTNLFLSRAMIEISLEENGWNTNAHFREYLIHKFNDEYPIISDKGYIDQSMPYTNGITLDSNTRQKKRLSIGSYNTQVNVDRDYLLKFASSDNEAFWLSDENDWKYRLEEDGKVNDNIIFNSNEGDIQLKYDGGNYWYDLQSQRIYTQDKVEVSDREIISQLVFLLNLQQIGEHTNIEHDFKEKSFYWSDIKDGFHNSLWGSRTSAGLFTAAKVPISPTSAVIDFGIDSIELIGLENDQEILHQGTWALMQLDDIDKLNDIRKNIQNYKTKSDQIKVIDSLRSGNLDKMLQYNTNLRNIDKMKESSIKDGLCLIVSSIEAIVRKNSKTKEEVDVNLMTQSTYLSESALIISEEFDKISRNENIEKDKPKELVIRLHDYYLQDSYYNIYSLNLVKKEINAKENELSETGKLYDGASHFNRAELKFKIEELEKQIEQLEEDNDKWTNKLFISLENVNSIQSEYHRIEKDGVNYIEKHSVSINNIGLNTDPVNINVDFGFKYIPIESGKVLYENPALTFKNIRNEQIEIDDFEIVGTVMYESGTEYDIEKQVNSFILYPQEKNNVYLGFPSVIFEPLPVGISDYKVDVVYKVNGIEFRKTCYRQL